MHPAQEARRVWCRRGNGVRGQERVWGPEWWGTRPGSRLWPEWEAGGLGREIGPLSCQPVGSSPVRAREVNRAHLCVVSFFKAFLAVAPSSGESATKSLRCPPGTCQGEAGQAGPSFAPTSGSEGQMSERGCGGGWRWW